MDKQAQEIEGLEWMPTHCVANGGESVVIPFPTTHLVHLVFHGERPFAHGQYGFHTGLEDRLTFLGPFSKSANGYFIDCRKDSPTLHNRVHLTFSPSSTRTLRIPCGVAHCFDGLEEVFTLNSFKAFLPPPDLLLTDKNPWATGADIYNFPLNTADEALPVVEPNPFPASEKFYELLSALQSETLDSVTHEYPVTEDITLSDGTTSTLVIRKKLSAAQSMPAWEPVGTIEGLGWKRHFTVWSGESAGYSAFTDASPLQVIEHGTSHYATDAYGIHLEWEDRLTFVGPLTQKAIIKFIDCRKGSPSYHQEMALEFSPSPLRFLVIPPGVAHAFDGLENIFTINRPRYCAGDFDKYDPGNDVVDWPLQRRPAPTFEVETHAAAPFAYYQRLVSMQQEYLKAPTELSTASILLLNDETGQQVKVAIRAKKHA